MSGPVLRHLYELFNLQNNSKEEVQLFSHFKEGQQLAPGSNSQKVLKPRLGFSSEFTAFFPSTRLFFHALLHKSRGITILKSRPFSICLCPLDKFHSLLFYALGLPAFSIFHPSPVILNSWVFPNLPGFLILHAYVDTTLSFWNISLANSYMIIL